MSAGLWRICSSRLSPSATASGHRLVRRGPNCDGCAENPTVDDAGTAPELGDTPRDDVGTRGAVHQADPVAGFHPLMRALVFWQFESADDLAAAASRLRALGFRRLYAYAPRKTWALEDALRGRPRSLLHALAEALHGLVLRLRTLLRRTTPLSEREGRYWIGVDENELGRGGFERACAELTARGMPLQGVPVSSHAAARRVAASKRSASGPTIA